MFKKILKITIVSLIGAPFLAFALSIFLPIQGGTGTSTAPTYGQLLVGNSGGTYTLTATSSLNIISFSTTSADYWYTIQDHFSTTSADNWKGLRDFFSTTSAIYFADSSTTIAKAYSNNTFTGTNSFTKVLGMNGWTNNGNGTTTSLTITGLTGLLKANDTTGPLTVAVGGVDYPGLSTTNVFTGGNIFSRATTTTLCFATGNCQIDVSPQGSIETLFFSTTMSDIPTYETIKTTPATTTETDDSCSAASGTAGGYCDIDSYVSTTTNLSLSSIPAGNWNAHTFTYVDNVGGTSVLERSFFRRTALGVETLMFQATSTDINTTTVAEMDATFTEQGFAFNPTDRLVIKIRGNTTSGTARVIHFVYAGTTHASHIETPISLGDFSFARLDGTQTFTGTNTFSIPPILSSLGTAAGTFLAVNATGNIIATSTPAQTYGDSNVNAFIHASTTIPKTYTANTFTALQSWQYSSSTLYSSFNTASTSHLTVSDNFITVGNKKGYVRWKDRMSIPQATSTDETQKFGTCLEQSGPSVTIDKISTYIASTSGGYDASATGILWNLNIAQSTSSSSPIKLFDVSMDSYGTSTVQTFTPTTTAATIPSGYCYWFAPSVASGTPQIQMFYFNIFGYEQ